MCFKAEKMISTLSPLPPPPQKYKFGSEARKEMTHFSLTEKRKRRKEGGKGGKRGGKEKGEKWKKEGRKERKEAKKECKCVFRLKKL